MLQINEEALLPSEAFPYLGRMIAYNNIDWMAVYQNLREARRWWGMIVRVLTKTGAMVQDRGMIYKAVSQFAFFYGSESLVVTV